MKAAFVAVALLASVSTAVTQDRTAPTMCHRTLRR